MVSVPCYAELDPPDHVNLILSLNELLALKEEIAIGVA
jgi:hypothetical protein